jgi:myo-inositol-1(or 4)-monophosphatase
MTTSDTAVAVAAARAGAAVALASWRTPVERHGKGGLDFATDADLASERAVRGVLREQRPDDAVTGEEYGSDGAAERTWLVDPICGTLNYAAGTPLWVVNVALREGDRVRVAAAADPASGEVFVTDGDRAWRDGSPDVPLAPDPANRLVEVEIHPSSTRSWTLLGRPGFHERFAPRVVSTSLGLPWVAAGRFAGYVAEEDVSDSVHYAAGLAVCRGAGCVVTDLDGGDVSSGRGLLVAADAATHLDLLGLLAGG